jgi:hypothetical protein
VFEGRGLLFALCQTESAGSPADPVMKLIIVERSKTLTYRRLKELFVYEINVEVVFERRRQRNGDSAGELATERRRLSKPWNGRDYIVIHIAN